MMLQDAIRNANSEHSVYQLLTAYLDTLQFSRKLPEYLTVLPIADLQDLDSRFENLVAEFESEMRVPDSHKFFVLMEAVAIFNLAAVRVCNLLTRPADQGEPVMKLPDFYHMREVGAA